MDNDIPELELPMQHCIEVGSPSVVISMTTVHKYFSNPPHPEYPSVPCTDWDKLKHWAELKGWSVMLATEDTGNGKQILPGIRFSPTKINTVPNTAANTTTKVPSRSNKQKSNILNIPIGYVWLTAIGTVLGVCIIYLIKTHLGISL